MVAPLHIAWDCPVSAAGERTARGVQKTAEGTTSDSSGVPFADPGGRPELERQAVISAIGALGLWVLSPAAASIIHHAPLEDVLRQVDWVIVATVESVDVREDNVQKLYTWTVRRERVLVSNAPVPDLPLMYSHRWPVLFDERGERIGTISPIYDGSGLEHDVGVGQTLIFMGKAPASEGAKVLFVDRVEPLDLEERIKRLLSDEPR